MEIHESQVGRPIPVSGIIGQANSLVKSLTGTGVVMTME